MPASLKARDCRHRAERRDARDVPVASGHLIGEIRLAGSAADSGWVATPRCPGTRGIGVAH